MAHKLSPSDKKKHNQTYYEKHKERIKENVKEYYHNHKEAHRNTSRRYKNRNRNKVRAAGRKYYHNNKTKDKAYKLRKLYGISLEEYADKSQAQNEVCLICGRINTKNRDLCVDHNHQTGRIRGLLCTGCNIRLGWFENNMETILKYLESYGQV